MFLAPVNEIRHKAMSLSADDAGGVFREDKSSAPSPLLTATTVLTVPAKTDNPAKPQPGTPTADEPATVLMDLPADLAAELVKLAETIAPEHRAEKGVERTPHVTCKYGLLCDKETVKAALADSGPVEWTLGEFRTFHGKDHDVLYVDCIAPALHRLNRLLSALPCVEDTHPKYVPHVTLAYLKAGAGRTRVADVYATAWNGAMTLNASGVAHELTYSGPDRVTCCLPLGSSVPARVNPEEVREKGYDEDEAGEPEAMDDEPDDQDTAEQDAEEIDHTHPLAQDITAEALRLLGAADLEDGTPAHAAREFMVELAHQWKANPEAGQAVLDRLRDDPEFREQILGHLNATTREKGMEGEGETAPAQPSKPVKQPKTPKPKAQKAKATPPAEPAAGPAAEPADQPTVPADKPAKGGRRKAAATPAEPPAEQPAPAPAEGVPAEGEKGGIHPDVMKHILATHELLHSMGSGPLTHEHLQQLTDHLRDTTHAHLDHYVNAHGISAKSGTKAVKAARIAQRLIGSRIPSVPYGLKEVPAEPPASSGLDEVIGHAMNRPHEGRQVAKHIHANPDAADKAAGDLAAAHKSTPAKPAADTPVPPTTAERRTDPETEPPTSPPADASPVPARPTAAAEPPADDADRTREIQPTPSFPPQRVPPNTPPIPIPGVQGFDDDGEGEGESDQSRTFPSSRPKTPAPALQAAPPANTDNETPPTTTPATASAAPKGHIRFHTATGGHFDMPAASVKSVADDAKALGGILGGVITHAVDDNGQHVYGTQAKNAAKAGGTVAKWKTGVVSEANPYGHTTTQAKWAKQLADVGHGEMRTVYPDGRMAVIHPDTGDEHLLDKNQVARVIRNKEYPPLDQQHWPQWVSDAHKQIQPFGAQVVEVLPGRKVKVKDADGNHHVMTGADLAKSIAAGKVIPSASSQKQAESDDLARQFEAKGFGTFVGHLNGLDLYHFKDKQGRSIHLRRSEVVKANNSGKPPNHQGVPDTEKSRQVKNILAQNPHLGTLNDVLAPSQGSKDTRFHIVGPDGKDHYPTMGDLIHAGRHKTAIPNSHGLEESQLGNVLGHNPDGTLHVLHRDGTSSLPTVDEFNAGVQAGGFPKKADVRPENRDDWTASEAAEAAEAHMAEFGRQRGMDPVAVQQHFAWMMRQFPSYTKKYGDTADTWRRMLRAARAVPKGGVKSVGEKYEAQLAKEFAQHPMNTGGMPSGDKEVAESVARARLGKFIRSTPGGHHLIHGNDGRARLYTLPELHKAIQAGQHKPVRDLPTGGLTPAQAAPAGLPVAQRLPLKARPKADAAGARVAALYKQHPEALEAINRNSRWAQTMAATHAHKVAHRFGGDVKKAEAALYAVIRHLAFAAHTRGVGRSAGAKLGGLGLKVTRRKGMGWDASVFGDGDPMAALLQMLA